MIIRERVTISFSMAIGSFNLTIEKKEVDLSDSISIGPLKIYCTWRAKLMRLHHAYKNYQRPRGSPKIKIFCLPLSQKLMRPSPANPGMLEPFSKNNARHRIFTKNTRSIKNQMGPYQRTPFSKLRSSY